MYVYLNFKKVFRHFFTIYFTASTSEPQTPAQNIDYNFARDELMLNELSNDPIQAAISRLEKQHEEDKQGKYHLDTSVCDLNKNLF